MDKIDKIVDRAIAYTESVIATSPERYRAARLGLERILDRLTRNAPGHPALERLRNYLDLLDKRDQP